MTAATHRCLCCEAAWTRHDDGTWSLKSNLSGQCCNNAPMGGQMVSIADMNVWKPTVEKFRRAASVRGMSDMRAYVTVRAIVAEAPAEQVA